MTISSMYMHVGFTVNYISSPSKLDALEIDHNVLINDREMVTVTLILKLSDF
jgi:hypothetical protein